MPYRYPFHRVVMIGTLYTDIFNVTLSMAPTNAANVPVPVSTALVTAVGNAVATWWPKDALPGAGNGIGIISAAKLTSVKVNRIGTDGRYMDAETMEWVAPAPIAGIDPTTRHPQLSLVTGLRGTEPRALAGRGRMYFPPSATTVQQPDGRVAVGTATAHGEGVKTLLQSIEAAFNVHTVPTRAVIVSNTRLGAVQYVTDITVGRVVDTMRSRRNKIVEAPVEIPYL